MSWNREKPHLVVIPEDRANRELVLGFLDHPNLDARRLGILPEAGGWRDVVKKFQATVIPYLQRYSSAQAVLLVDFDRDSQRFAGILLTIPETLRSRVFIIGAWSEPEELKAILCKSFPAIGLNLANDCYNETEITWGHTLLSHNVAELSRLRKSVRGFLFNL